MTEEIYERPPSKDFELEYSKSAVYFGIAKEYNHTTETYDIFDITTDEIKMEIRERDNEIWEDRTLWKLILASNTDPTTTGKFEVTFATSDSTKSDIGVYDYKILYKPGTASEKTLADGKFTIY